MRPLSPHTTVHAGPHTAVQKIELRVTNEVGHLVVAEPFKVQPDM